jgi:predicted GIY-YIG superfamily endonuclease
VALHARSRNARGDSVNGAWSVYLLRCGDGTLYCGIALDVAARLEAHRSGKGAKYTKGRGPLALIYNERCKDKSTALRREREIKRMDRTAKLALVEK